LAAGKTLEDQGELEAEQAIQNITPLGLSILRFAEACSIPLLSGPQVPSEHPDHSIHSVMKRAKPREAYFLSPSLL
jgi:hypothetical protein